MISVWKLFVHAVPSACRPSGGACWLWFVCQWSCCHWTQTHSRRQTTLRHAARPRWRKSSIWWRRLRQTFSRTSTRSRRDSRQTAGVPVRSQQPSTRPVRLVLSCLDNNIVKRPTEYHANEIGSLTLATCLSAAVLSNWLFEGVQWTAVDLVCRPFQSLLFWGRKSSCV